MTRSEHRSIGSYLLDVQRRYSFALILVIAAALLIVNLLTSEGGFGWSDEMANLAPLAIAAMASAPAIISGGGGLDLSVSPLMTFAGGVFVAWLAPRGLAGAVGVPILLLIGAAVGTINGLLIVILRVPAVIVTLGMYFALTGIDSMVLPSPTSIHGSWIGHLAGDVGPIPGALFTLGVPLLIWFALRLVPYRRLLNAVGSNDAAAFASGVNVTHIRVGAYALGGLIAAIGGLALTALTLSADAGQAQAYTLVAITAVALGGTSLWGGRGGLFGPLLGAAAIYLLQDLLGTLEINTTWVQVVYGGALVVAVVLGGLVTRTKAAA